MVRTVRPAGIVVGVAIYLLLMICGCQKERASGPAAQAEPPAHTTMDAEPQASAPVASPLPQTTPETPEAQIVPPEPNEADPTIRLVLKFSPGQAATYKVTVEAEKSVEWMGAVKPAGYADGRSGNRVEITFEQQVREVRANGNAVLGITIRALKYLGQTRSEVVFDFDSGRAEDRDNPLMSLMGKSYGLEMSPGGEVVALLDMESVRQAVKVGSPAYSVASKLFSTEVVRDRHEVPPLSALKGGQARPGQSWSDLKSFSFGDMGLKGYERVYTLKQIRPEDGRSAFVEMKAIPSAAMAQELHRRRPAGPPSGLFDNTESYEGRLEFDLDGGWICECDEQMWTEWIIVDPTAEQGAAPPRALKMGARRLYRLELVR